MNVVQIVELVKLKLIKNEYRSYHYKPTFNKKNTSSI